MSINKPLRIVYMGSPEFAVPGLEAIHKSPHEICAVVSGFDKRRGRGNQTSPTPVKQKAIDLDIPVFEAEDMRSQELHDYISDLNPDMIVIVAFKILPSSLIAVPKIGAINLHASLLPAYRGAAPIHHAVIQGEEKTGNTIFFLDSKIDTGEILLQKEIPIGQNETTGEVYERLMHLGGEMLPEALDLISGGEYTLSKQDDSLASKAPKIFPDDAKIDLDLDALSIHNLIRGMSPFPGAWGLLDGKKLKIYRTEIQNTASTNKATGRLFIEDGKAYLECKDGALILSELQYEGRQRMNGYDFLLGYQDNAILN